MSKMLGCSGTTTLSAIFSASLNSLPCIPAGVSSTTCVVPLGGRAISLSVTYHLVLDYDIDVAAEQAAVDAAQLVVMQHPIQWYSMPALMKLWVDEVLTYGWAYGQGGTALQGKDLWLVGTTGGPESSYHPQSYNRYFF